MKLALLLALMIIGLTAVAAPKDKPKATIKEIDKLIQDLGADKFNVRKEAKARLKKMGYLARKRLAKFQDTKDPEIRASILEILQALRWEIIPGAADDVRALIDDLKQGGNGNEIWEKIAKNHPIAMIDLIIELGADAKLGEKVHTGIYSFLMHAPPQEAADRIRKLPAADRRFFIGQIDRAYIDFYETKREQMLLFYCLDDYKRTIARARRYWTTSEDQLAIDISAIAFMRAGCPNSIWETGGERCLNEPNPSKRCRKLTFYIGIAKRLRMPHIVRSFMRLNEDALDKCNADALQTLVAMLDEMGMKKASFNQLNGRQDPWLMYQFLYRFNKENGMKMQEADLKKVMSSAKTDEQLLRLAVHVTKYNIDHALAALKRITTTPPMESNYDTEARKMMTQIEEDRGNFAAAAGDLEEYIKLKEKARTSFPALTAALQAHAKELRKLANLVTPKYREIMKKASQALASKNYDAAVKGYNEAIKLAPKISIPYQKLFSIYRELEHYAPYRATAKALLTQEPVTTRDLVVWAAACADLMMLDKARGYLKMYEQKSPGDYVVKGIQAQIDERSGELEKAMTYYSSGEISMSNRQMGLILLKQEKNKEAIELLQKYLITNPFDEYSRLWLFIGRSRLKQDDRKAVKKFIEDRRLSPDAWATKLLMYYAGQITREKLLATAEQDEAPIRPARLCEAQFYIAELDRINGEYDLARKGFKDVMSHKIPMYIEHHWAALELTKMAKANAGRPARHTMGNQ